MVFSVLCYRRITHVRKAEEREEEGRGAWQFVRDRMDI